MQTILRVQENCGSSPAVAALFPKMQEVACASRHVGHGDVFKVGGVEMRVIETHGHTNSHMAYLVDGTHALTGDALFIRGCGRTDFQGGDAGTLYDHVTQRLFTLGTFKLKSMPRLKL